MSVDNSSVRRIDVARNGHKRHGLLDAVSDLLAASDWREISMEKIALGAGVSRQTVYNEFGSRAGLEAAYVKREVDRFVDHFEQAASSSDLGPTGSLEAATFALLTATRSNLMVLAITRGGADELLALFTTQGRPIVAHASQRLSAFFLREWDWLSESAAQALAELLVRLAISHGALAMDNDANTARAIALITGPFVEAARSEAALPTDLDEPVGQSA